PGAAAYGGQPGSTQTGELPGAGGREGRGRRRVVDAAIAAIVAAVVAAGTTAAVMSTDDSPASSTTTSGTRAAGTSAGPVVQANGGSIDWNAVATKVEPSVVAISISSQSGSGQGSGVVLDDAGHVLTNNHVASAGGSNAKLQVTLNDGRTYDASVVGTDPSTDLAVLKMSGATDLTPATLGDSDAVQVGQNVMAVGNPLGLAGTVTTGIVSALDRPVTTSSEEEQQQSDPFGQGQGGDSSASDPVVTNAIQTDAAVNPGNSGGALVDTSGRVVGIPSSIASLGQSAGSSQSGSIGLGFSIPINEAKAIADQLISSGTADHPYLGVTLDDGTVKDGTATRAAAVVQTVSSGTPAANAGLRQGDAVIAVNGDPVNGSESLVAQIREKQVGAKVELTTVRSGSERKVSVTLTKRPTTGQ
ncbi:S1C family serine protease, partial [Angustibacter aerolatus]